MTSEKVLSFFREILAIPRESGHEEQINAYLQKFASERNLECKVDSVGNVLIIKEAAPGYENHPTIVLQSHSDMVCEKNSGVEHDFSKDTIKYVIKDGWMIAEDTTLGADCGIGVAASLALMDDDDFKCGKIESLFTVSEETGLNGAFGLQDGFFSGKILINLDSEDEGQLFVGCAGGIDTTCTFTYTPIEIEKGKIATKFSILGGIGGHSGDDINKGRANAVQLLGRFLYEVLPFGYDLCYIDGGNKRNAIAREAYAIIAFDEDAEDGIVETFNRVISEIKEEYAKTDPNITGEAEPVDWKNPVIDPETAESLVTALICAPHGVLAMSPDIKDLVETSSNLASVKMQDNNTIRVGSSQRSAINSSRKFAGARFEACFVNAGAEVVHGSEYPGWQPKLDSYILGVTVESYKRLFGVDPIVRAIHAGLECGLFLDKYPDLDMISFGPTILGVHAPGERLELASLDKFVELLQDVVKNA